MSDKNNFKISEDKRQSWGSLAMIWIGSMICVPCLMIGGVLSTGFSIGGAVICILLGYAIVCAYMCFMGMQGCDTGLPTVSMAAATLGERGSQFIISLLLTIACIGWFGVQSAVCGSAFSAMINNMTGFMIPEWISSVFWGIVMLLTAMYGYKAVKYLNYIAVPALILVLGYGVWAALFRNDGFAVIAAYKPAQPMSLVSGISLVVATFALGGVISGDYSRYAKNRGDVIKSTVFGVLPSGLAVLLIGASLSIATGEYDISSVLSSLGVPAVGLLALVLATWTTNVTNAYSGGLAVSNLLGLGEGKFKITTCIAGLIGTILGAIGIMGQFSNFLSILTAFIPPVAGVIIAGYWILGKGKKENFVSRPGVYVPGVIAFAVGAIVAFVTEKLQIFVAPINGIVVSMLVYVLFEKLMPKKLTQVAVNKRVK